MSKKLGHSNSLRRRCFAKSNLRLDSCNTSADEDCSMCQTPGDHTQASINVLVEDADCKRSPNLQRRYGSVTPNIRLSSPQHEKPRFLIALNHSISGSSIDSGVGLSRASSLSSLPHSKRPSRESSNTVDIASPLLESRQPLGSGAERLSIDDHSRCPSRLSDCIIADEPTRILNSQSEGILSCSNNDDDDDVDDLTRRTDRVSITRDSVDDLKIAVQKLFNNIQQQPESGHIQRQMHLHVDSVESDGPRFTKRRHSAADPYMPLTQRHQRLSRQVERKRSAQPLFHRSMEDSSSSTHSRRKPSACNVCGRRHREPTMSAPSVIVKTTRFPDHQKRRRYSEVLKVCKLSEIPYTEVRLVRIEEFRQRETDKASHQRLPQKQTRSLPRTLFSRQSQPKLPDVVRDEQLQFILERNMPKFLEYTDWNVLFSHLVSEQLLSSECREVLLCPLRTNIVKGNYFYGQVLPKMGRESEAYIKLCQCLEDTKTEHLGHGTLFDIISKGRQRYYYNKYCQCHMNTSRNPLA